MVRKKSILPMLFFTYFYSAETYIEENTTSPGREHNILGSILSVETACVVYGALKHHPKCFFDVDPHTLHCN